MILKMAGVILICISSTFLGIYRASKIKFHISDLLQLSNALCNLKSEIEFGITPLDLACKNIFDRSNSFVATIFFQIYQMLSEKNLPAKNIWLSSMDMLLKNSFVDSEDIEIVKSFSNVISNFDRSLQSNCLSKIENQLQKKISLLQNQYVIDKKLYYNLGFLLGLLTIIIFI